jgi:hypothetical protein
MYDATSCEFCGSKDIEITKSSGGVDSGQFTEHYVCEGCGETGRIIGRAEQPVEKWEYRGRIFNG